MRLVYNEDTDEVLSLVCSVELALLFNPTKNKNRIVQKVCTHARHRFKGNMKYICNEWRNLADAYQRYESFAKEAGLI